MIALLAITEGSVVNCIIDIVVLAAISSSDSPGTKYYEKVKEAVALRATVLEKIEGEKRCTATGCEVIGEALYVDFGDSIVKDGGIEGHKLNKPVRWISAKKCFKQ